jgi:hypothetical protein
MKKCWANSFGKCGDIITKEHLISNSILQKKVVVQGFDWCKNEPKEIGSASLENKFLCNHHNNSLSPCDSEIAKFVDTIETFFRTKNKFNKYGFSTKKVPIEYNINGILIEKWFIKTLINISLTNEKEVVINLDKILPTLFSDMSIEKPFGFSFAIREGQTINFKDEISIIPLFNHNNDIKELAGGIFIFRGFTIMTLIPCSKFPILDNSLSIDNKEFEGLQLNWHNNEISEQMNLGKKTYKTQSIIFSW